MAGRAEGCTHKIGWMAGCTLVLKLVAEDDSTHSLPFFHSPLGWICMHPSMINQGPLVHVSNLWYGCHYMLAWPGLNI